MSDTPKTLTRPVRFEVPTDLVVYAALVGKAPEIDPTLADPMVAATIARRENPWSPAVLSVYLRQVAKVRASRINKPELTAWFKRKSASARKRFSEGQIRVTAARTRAA